MLLRLPRQMPHAVDLTAVLPHMFPSRLPEILEISQAWLLDDSAFVLLVRNVAIHGVQWQYS